MPTLTKRERSVAAKFRKYEKAREEASTLYDRADRILLDIAHAMKGPSCRIRDDGKLLVLTDLAAEAIASDDQVILGWGHGAVRRFALKTVKP